VAAQLSRLHRVPGQAGHVVMTVGAAGALNCVLKAILDPGDEVVVWAPYFPEYPFYIDNHGGTLVVAETTKDFDLDVAELERKVTARTRAVIVNTPNNPTGRVYRREQLTQIGEVLAAAEARHGRPIFLLSDEPYRKIVFGVTPPSLFDAHRNAIICTSHSKDLGLPGERIGFAAINPDCEGASELFGALAFTNRILGYVNAPALMQRVVADLQDVFIDPEVYRRKRDLFVVGLRDAGYDVVEPEGAFYLFPRSPIADDVEFVKLLASKLVLTVPGVGFARAGHFRLAYCCDDSTILNALPRFAEALRDATRA
jgi:aspartate aminotransferase